VSTFLLAVDFFCLSFDSHVLSLMFCGAVPIAFAGIFMRTVDQRRGLMLGAQ
jgi:hypothetical protein